VSLKLESKWQKYIQAEPPRIRPESFGDPKDASIGGDDKREPGSRVHQPE
jgi:hypothetical protein